MNEYQNSGKKIVKWSVITVLGLLVLGLLFSSVYTVAPGHRGVMVVLGKVVQKSLPNGVGLKVPFVSDVTDVDVRTQVIKDSTETYTKDMQTAKIKYNITYDLAPNNVHVLYENIGLDYKTKLIFNHLNDVLKDVIGKWQAQDLVSNRDKARVEIIELLQTRLDKRFIQNVLFQLNDIDYSDKFEGAIEDKVIAEQKAQEAVNNTKRIKEEAEQKLISAKAEAEAMEIKSEALSKNKGLTEYEAVQKWDGQLPQYMFGNSTPFVNIGGK